jgi:hypothetical protein
MQAEDPYRLIPEAEAVRSANPFRAVRPRLHGFRFWMSVNHELAVVFCFIAAYASLILYLVALIAFGRESLLSRSLILILIASVCFAWLLIRMSQRRRRLTRTEHGWQWIWGTPRIWVVYRPVKTERVEKIVAAVLWSFISMAVLVVLLLAAHNPR